MYFYRRRDAFLADVFGVLPDFASFAPFVLLSAINGTFAFGKPELSAIPDWVFQLYNYSHSLVVFLFVFGVVWLILKKPVWALAGWGIHILLDIPTHTISFFPTPFLYPVSSYIFSGVQWSEPWFVMLNYGSFAALYAYLFLQKKHSLVRR